ncbi:alpha/beta hydrolase [Archangium sp.]|jgi:pimeloyl-ACP methyl ester carboxylesterase|uniref:alpha/beta fold hydrolase n=1 Tax=Archangium sp. TaxID=1872627 RepID=UPI002EDAB55D
MNLNRSSSFVGVSLLALGALLTGCREDPPAPPEVCTSVAPESTQVDTGGLTLHAVTQGCGKPIVFLHGFPAFSFTWEPIQSRLASEFSTFAPDQRGFAPSPVPQGVSHYELPRLMEDAVGFIRAVSDEPVVLVTHDWGAAVGWMVASKHPELVRGLVVVNGPHPDTFRREIRENEAQKKAAQYMNFFMSSSAEGALTANNSEGLARVVRPYVTPEVEQRYRQAWAQPGTVTGGLNWYRANLVQGPNVGPSFPSNVSVSMPVHVIWGLKDDALLPGNLVGLEAFTPKLTVRELPNSGHWPMYQEADLIAEDIRTFINGLP